MRRKAATAWPRHSSRQVERYSRRMPTWKTTAALKHLIQLRIDALTETADEGDQVFAHECAGHEGNFRWLGVDELREELFHLILFAAGYVIVRALDVSQLPVVFGLFASNAAVLLSSVLELFGSFSGKNRP